MSTKETINSNGTMQNTVSTAPSQKKLSMVLIPVDGCYRSVIARGDIDDMFPTPYIIRVKWIDDRGEFTVGYTDNPDYINLVMEDLPVIYTPRPGYFIVEPLIGDEATKVINHIKSQVFRKDQLHT